MSHLKMLSGTSHRGGSTEGDASLKSLINSTSDRAHMKSLLDLGGLCDGEGENNRGHYKTGGSVVDTNSRTLPALSEMKAHHEKRNEKGYKFAKAKVENKVKRQGKRVPSAEREHHGFGDLVGSGVRGVQDAMRKGLSTMNPLLQEGVQRAMPYVNQMSNRLGHSQGDSVHGQEREHHAGGGFTSTYSPGSNPIRSIANAVSPYISPYVKSAAGYLAPYAGSIGSVVGGMAAGPAGAAVGGTLGNVAGDIVHGYASGGQIASSGGYGTQYGSGTGQQPAERRNVYSDGGNTREHHAYGDAVGNQPNNGYPYMGGQAQGQSNPNPYGGYGNQGYMPQNTSAQPQMFGQSQPQDQNQGHFATGGHVKHGRKGSKVCR